MAGLLAPVLYFMRSQMWLTFTTLVFILGSSTCGVNHNSVIVMTAS